MGLESLFKEIFRSIWRIFREIIRLFTFWESIDEPPSWVRNAFERYARRLPTHPYDVIKHYVGKNHIYKVYCETIRQGQIKEHWYVKQRIR